MRFHYDLNHTEKDFVRSDEFQLSSRMINDGDYPAEKHQYQGRRVIKLRMEFFNGEKPGRADSS